MKYSFSLCSWFPGREAASLAAGRANEVVCVRREHGFSAEESWETCSGQLAGLQMTQVRLGKAWDGGWNLHAGLFSALGLRKEILSQHERCRSILWQLPSETSDPLLGLLFWCFFFLYDVARAG